MTAIEIDCLTKTLSNFPEGVAKMVLSYFHAIGTQKVHARERHYKWASILEISVGKKWYT